MKLFRKIGAKLEKMQNKAFEKRLRQWLDLPIVSEIRT